MQVDYQIVGIDYQPYADYFAMSEAELKTHNAYLFVSDKCPDNPCRVSLEDAEIGETVLAIHYEHYAIEGPYRSAGPIFIREHAQPATVEPNVIPTFLRHRLLSVRGYNRNHIMIEADATRGDELEDVLRKQFSNSEVDVIHVHNAGPGCFNCAVQRL